MQENTTACEKNDDSDCNEEAYEESFELLDKAKKNDMMIPSPISIDVSKSTKIKLPRLKWHGYETMPRKMKLTNSGKTVILSAKWEHDSPYITSGPFGDAKYVFSDVHFHWGKSALEGSEHLIEGNQCALEMHVVLTKDEYENHEEAVKRDDGVVILVYLYEVRYHHNPVLQRILLHLEQVRQANTDYHLKPFEISRLIMPFGGEYYAYWGSLISKGELCPIFWIISRHLNSISIAQLQIFHLLLDPTLRAISRNWKPVTNNSERTLFFVNPESPITSRTMNAKPIMYQDNMHNTSNVSVPLGTPAARQSRVSGSL